MAGLVGTVERIGKGEGGKTYLRTTTRGDSQLV